MAGSWTLAHYMFNTSFTPDPIPILIIFMSVCLLTILIGLANSRNIVDNPPLEVLRQES
jgi:putative ABC transport system permease protein